MLISTKEYRRLSRRLKTQMNISTEQSQNGSSVGASRIPRSDPVIVELTQLKKDLLKAEVQLAKARATVSGAEVDVKVINARLRALTK